MPKLISFRSLLRWCLWALRHPRRIRWDGGNWAFCDTCKHWFFAVTEPEPRRLFPGFDDIGRFQPKGKCRRCCLKTEPYLRDKHGKRCTSERRKERICSHP